LLIHEVDVHQVLRFKSMLIASRHTQRMILHWLLMISRVFLGN
jgi:hypothetical protein